MPLKVSGKTGEIGQALRSRMTDTVSAAGHVELAKRPAVWFGNANQGGRNFVYRRSDGKFGWIDPALMERCYV